MALRSFRLVAIFAVALCTSSPTFAQRFGGGFFSGFQGVPSDQNMVTAYGDPVVVPAQYSEGCPSGTGCYGECGGDGLCNGGGFGPMGGGMMGGNGCYGQVPGEMADPFNGAYLNTEQCGPHYFDFMLEAVFLQRDSFGDRDDFALSSLNIGGPTVISTADLENKFQTGFRAVARYDVGALSVVEGTYMGIYDFDSESSFRDPNPVSNVQGNLFSLFSEFGNNPAGGIGLAETDRAVFHKLIHDSELQTAELTYRRYWVGYSPRISGTVLTGFRYTQLSELMNFRTEAVGALDARTDTKNELYGWQVGGDGWLCLIQGLRIGTEQKVGLYANNLRVRNRILATDGTPNVQEFFDEDQASFIYDSRFDLVADLLPSWSFRIGYELLWINSVALAFENFNTGSPYANLGPQRIPFLADQGDAFYHGFHVGAEYVW